MKTYDYIPNLTNTEKHLAIALGTFDGIHVGHQKVISRVVELAKKNNGKSIVFTFSNHPLKVLDPDNCPPQILTQESKAKLIEALGVDILINISFDKGFLTLLPDEFINMLYKNLLPKHIVVGPNYSYGYKSAGTIETLIATGKDYGFIVEVVNGVHIDNVLASSTVIRNLILAGDVKKGACLLGRPYELTGVVITGDGRGRTLGFPTANINAERDLLLPGNGVYAVEIAVDGKQYQAVANIGTNPTFRVHGHRFEVFIIDFNEDIYGKDVSVTFLCKLRQEKMFSTAKALVEQIASDIRAAQHYFQ